MSKKIQSVTKNSSNKNQLRTDVFMVEFDQTYKKEVTSVLLKLFIKQEGKIFSKSCSEDTFILTPKPKKNTLKLENQILISIMNINLKVLNKLPGNQIQQQIKRIIHYGQVRFFPVIQG